MINWFRKHFIPYHGNDHRPHFLQKKTTRYIILTVLFLEIFSFLIPTLTYINKTGGMAAVLPAVLSELTNEQRQSQNLQVLTVNPILVKAAEMKANDMATKGYFAHTSPEGKTPWYWLAQAGYKYQYAGENLAVDFSDSQDVTRAWMNSPTHRANIVKDKYTEVGTGIATGVFEGRQTVFVAQVYANPLIIKPAVITPKKVEIKKVAVTPVITDEKKIGIPANILGVDLNKTDEQSVLGAETITTIPVEKEIIQKEESSISLEKEINKEESLEQTENPTILQKAIASPRNTTSTILNIILSITTIVLLLYIFIKRKNHEKDLVTNGLFILVIIGAIFIANCYLSNRNTVITQSFDYSIDNQ